MSAFSPDGRVLASAGSDHTVRLWNPETGDGIGVVLEGHSDVVTDVAFSPEGQLISAGADARVLFWGRPWDVQAACELAARYVTAAQVASYLAPGQEDVGCELNDHL